MMWGTEVNAAAAYRQAKKHGWYFTRIWHTCTDPQVFLSHASRATAPVSAYFSVLSDYGCEDLERNALSLARKFVSKWEKRPNARLETWYTQAPAAGIPPCTTLVLFTNPDAEVNYWHFEGSDSPVLRTGLGGYVVPTAVLPP